MIALSHKLVTKELCLQMNVQSVRGGVMKIKKKSCKRKKCPHYKEIYRLCDICEWNPNRVWISRGEKND